MKQRWVSAEEYSIEFNRRLGSKEAAARVMSETAGKEATYYTAGWVNPRLIASEMELDGWAIGEPPSRAEAINNKVAAALTWFVLGVACGVFWYYWAAS